MTRSPRRTNRFAGFTLIELLVVVAIIALLIGILVPALGAARTEGRAAVSASNQRQIGQAVATYVADFQYFPPSYVYGNRETGLGWNVDDQISGSSGNPVDVTFGYVHWSTALFDIQSLNIEAFEAPVLNDGGAPATNPGSNPNDWVPNQQDDAGNTQNSTPSDYPEDRQAKRVAFSGNDAIFPRNKFVRAGGSTQPLRLYQLVQTGRITDEARTILAAEFNGVADYRAVSQSLGGDAIRIKSHRPISPFVPGGGFGAASEWPDVQDTDLSPSGGFSFYYPEETLYTQFEAARVSPEAGILDNVPPLAVGQHYPGGKSNFVFADGHVERLSPQETFDRFLWGDRYYSLTGPNKVFRGVWTEAE
ncbi:MAG: type II secretion system protein [Phycisphaerales bacterium]